METTNELLQKDPISGVPFFSLRPEEKVVFKHCFTLIDKNCDGYIEAREFARFITKGGTQVIEHISTITSLQTSFCVSPFNIWPFAALCRLIGMIQSESVTTACSKFKNQQNIRHFH